MSSFNQVILTGRLGQAPEVRTFDNGDMVANLSVATTESWKDKGTGDKRERTDWHRVVLQTSGLARVAQQYLGKGDLVQVCGQLRNREWTDANGVKRYATEVVVGPRGQMVMLGSAKGGGAAPGPAADDRDDPGSWSGASDVPF